MKMQLTLFTLGAIATALSWTPAVDASAHGISHNHHNRMAVEKRQSFSGKATFYNTETGNAGSCGDYLKNSQYVVAVNAVQYNQAWCGRTITVHANGKSHSAVIKDMCPGDGVTCKWGALDLSPALFRYFADESVGVIDISWGFGGAVQEVVNGLTGGNKNKGSSNNNSNNNNNDDNDEEEEEERQKAAASKAAAEASRSSASAAAYASATAAAASRSSVAHASSTSAAASRSSASAARASRASVSRASVSVHRSKASVASVSRASVSSVSRASVSSEKASRSSAAASASAEAARPKNLENFDAIFGGLQQLAMAAQT